MMRALWSAASGMKGQQLHVDSIANNLANVNTTAYKKDRVEFKDLVYQTLNKGYNIDGEGRPVNLQVGLGSMPVATLKDYSVGTIQQTEQPLDFAINGEGFFMLQSPQGEVVYTKNGAFKISADIDGKKIVNSEGYPLLDTAGNQILLDIENLDNLVVNESGEITYVDAEGNITESDQTIGIVKFSNPAGLLSLGSSNYAQTSNSGEAVLEIDDDGEKSAIKQGFLEGSNVQIVEEMVNLIIAQRAYEINSKAVQSSDEMLEQANNLRR